MKFYRLNFLSIFPKISDFGAVSLPNVGDEVNLECIRRGLKCMEAVTSDSQLIADDMNNEIFQQCECTGARFTCKKEGSIISSVRNGVFAVASFSFYDQVSIC